MSDSDSDAFADGDCDDIANYADLSDDYSNGSAGNCEAVTYDLDDDVVNSVIEYEESKKPQDAKVQNQAKPITAPKKPVVNITRKTVSTPKIETQPLVQGKQLENTSDSKPKAKASTAAKAVTIDENPESCQKSENTPKTKKDLKTEELEASLIPDPDTIENLTKGLDPAKTLIKRSPIENDTILLCLLIKANKLNIKDYKCSKSACKVKKTWNDKQIQLLIHRKNGVESDLTPANLELLCPNCYMQAYGSELFKKQISKTAFMCKYCKFPLVNFSNSRKKGGVCLSCEKRLISISAEHDDITYENQMKTLYKDNPYLSNDLGKSKYYKEVSQFKTFTGKSSKPKGGDLSSIKPSEKSIVIDCNMDIGDIGDLTDLIKVEEVEDAF
jgi:5-methylcytosine-specific restriction endonuclease McrA